MSKVLYLADPGTPLTEREVRGAFSRAWSSLPRLYRLQEKLSFFLTGQGALLCLWRSAPSSIGMQAFLYDAKNRKWKNVSFFFLQEKK